MVVARRKAVTTTVKVVCFLCCCCCRWWSSLQFSASGLLEALASSVVVFHWSFESRGLEGQSQGGAVNLVFVAQMRCCFSASISLLLRSSSLSSLCSSLFLTSVTCLTLYSHRSPEQKCIFQSNLVSDKIYPPTKKYLHYTLYLYCKDRKEPLSSSFIWNIDCGSHNQFSNWCCFLLLRALRKKTLAQ